MKTLTYTCLTGQVTPSDLFVGENESTELVIDFTGTGTDTWSKGVVVQPFQQDGFSLVLGEDVEASTLIPVGWLVHGRMSFQPYAVSTEEQVMRFPVKTVAVSKSLEHTGDTPVMGISVVETLQSQISLKANKTYVDAQDVNLQNQITSNDEDILDLQNNKADITYVDSEVLTLEQRLDLDEIDIAKKADKTYVDSQDAILLQEINALDLRVDELESDVQQAQTDISDLQNGKAPLVHTHAISDVIDLQDELDTKVDKVLGKGLSTEDYTSAEKLKLSGIEVGAEVNNLTDIEATDLTDGGDTTLHTHDSRYYTKSEINSQLGDIESALDEILGGA